MSTLREAAQQALEAVQGLFDAEAHEGGPRSGHINTPATRDYWVRLAQARKALHESVSNLRDALAQEEQEPVAWMTHGDNTLPLFHKTFAAALCWGACPTPLYTRPPRHDIAYESACGIINEQDKKLAELEAVNAELLEALKVMLYKTERHVLLPGATPAPESPVALARAAIAKAEGQK